MTLARLVGQRCHGAAKQQILEIRIVAIKRAGRLATITPLATAKVFDVVLVHEVRFGGKCAFNPLPTREVARRVAIEQEPTKQFGSLPPIQTAEVAPIGGEPKAGMIVQVAGLVKVGQHGIDAGQTRFASDNVERQAGIAGNGVLGLFDVVLEAAAVPCQHFGKVVAPRQLPEELLKAARIVGKPLAKAIAHFHKGNHAVPDIGG